MGMEFGRGGECRELAGEAREWPVETLEEAQARMQRDEDYLRELALRFRARIVARQPEPRPQTKDEVSAFFAELQSSRGEAEAYAKWLTKR